MGSLNHHPRRAAQIAAVEVLCFCLLAGGAYAKPIKQEFQDLKITYTALMMGTAADSIDLVVLGDTKPLTRFQATIKADGFTVAAGAGFYKLTPTNGTIADGSMVTIRIKSVGAYKGKIGLQSAVFLSGAINVGQGAATGGDLKGDPIYTISDDVIGSPSLTVEDLSFYENHPAVDFATLDPSLPIDMTGIPEPNVTLPGAGAADPFGVPSITNNDYFIAQGEVVTQGGSAPVAWFVDGYTTAPIPETGVWALMSVGLGGVGVALRARRRTAPAAA